MRKVAIIQPSYLPWKGHFDAIHAADVFVFLDDVQYTTRDWRNRNRIKTRDGRTRWISVPVLGGRNQRICDTVIDRSRDWPRKHLESIRHSYGETPHFDRYFSALADVLSDPPNLLSELNQTLTRLIADWLSIPTAFLRSSDYSASGAKDDRLIALILAVGANHYISGPSARAYIDPEKFRAHGIGLEFLDYSPYPIYPQISEPFEHHVSVLDLLFMKGPAAPDCIWGAGDSRTESSALTGDLKSAR